MFLLLLVTCFVLTPFYIIYKPPSLLISYFEHRWPDVLFRVSTQKKIVALTIDDGPSEYTTQILDILKENGATATWFVIGGQVEGKQSVLSDVVKAGNELGNHAMHDEPSRSLSDDELARQIAVVEKHIHRAYDDTGLNQSPPRYFRPGSGFFSDRMRALLKKLEYRVVLGNVYPHDPQIPYWRVNAAHILSMVRPGSIIICHDRRSWTVPMLKKIIPEIKSKGYQITTVSKLLSEAHGPAAELEAE